MIYERTPQYMGNLQFISIFILVLPIHHKYYHAPFLEGQKPVSCMLLPDINCEVNLSASFRLDKYYCRLNVHNFLYSV